jgi:hypothetical protein
MFSLKVDEGGNEISLKCIGAGGSSHVPAWTWRSRLLQQIWHAWQPVRRLPRHRVDRARAYQEWPFLYPSCADQCFARKNQLDQMAVPM